MSQRKISGVVTDDPTKGAPAGTALTVASKLCPHISGPIAGSLQEWDAFGGILLQIMFHDGGLSSIEGSAVMIGPGIAITARHVLDSYIDRLLSGKLETIVVSIYPGSLIIWRIHQIILTETDIAILRVDLASSLPESGELPVATITTRTPVLGERLMILGFQAPKAASLIDGIEGATHVGIGEVTAVYPAGRDSVMMPHPCIEVKCLTRGGMSGGPAFDQNGKLVGLLSTSFEDHEGPSYVSMLWPVMAAPIETCWPSGILELPTNIISMTEHGVIWVDDLTALNFDEESGQLAYQPWS